MIKSKIITNDVQELELVQTVVGWKRQRMLMPGLQVAFFRMPPEYAPINEIQEGCGRHRKTHRHRDN